MDQVKTIGLDIAKSVFQVHGIAADGTVVIRLHGMDAPEFGQVLWWRNQNLDGGAMALVALDALTASIQLKCVPVERDRHRRLVAKCVTPKGIDIGRRIVPIGWTLAYCHYSEDYVDSERIARK